MTVNDKYRVRFRDLAVVSADRKRELLNAVERVLEHGQFLMGSEVEAFENRVAQYCDGKYCVGVGSGTDALYLSLRALDLQPGDEVITTPLSWVATLNAIHLAGGTPVFVDIGEDLNINAELIEKSITPRTRSIVPVHYTGRLCNMEEILRLSRKFNLSIIEDAAQAFGAHYNNRFAGSFGEMSAFSMNPMKVLSGFGEAGAIVTNNVELYRKLQALRYLGTVDREVCVYPALNAKIDTLQAAMLLCNFQYLEEIIDKRIEIANHYTASLANYVSCPRLNTRNNRESVFFDYTVLARSRNQLRQYLDECGIEVKVKHPTLMMNQPAYRNMYWGDCPVAEEAVGNILCLPIHEKMNEEDLNFVIEKIKLFYGN